MVQALNDLWTSGSGGPTVNIMEAARSGSEPAVLSRDVKRVLTVTAPANAGAVGEFLPRLSALSAFAVSPQTA